MAANLPGYGSLSGMGGGAGSYSSEAGREPGARRRKLAAMAGKFYSAGATAVNEIKESYNQTRTAQNDDFESSKITIPGSFPDVKIVTKGNEQMVLFPSYAKRHIKSNPRRYANPGGPPGTASIDIDEEDYWRQEWARHEDEKAVVDVDVRGWIYNPHKGPMTRRNRVLIGLARQLSGVPAPRAPQQEEPSLGALHGQHEEEREQARIIQKAQEIESTGKAEQAAALQGGYSEPPRDQNSEDEGEDVLRPHRSSAATPRSTPGFHKMRISRTSTTGGSKLSEAEHAVANANLMARLGPFLTTPLVEMPITVFFYNDTQSQSRTVETNDSGHFIMRAALDFIPTHVRVLANEDVSATEPVHIIEPKGISLISDIDDTIKHSSIALGAKEIFRNTFVRDLSDLTVDGVREWYSTLYDLGVTLHYCSNSPWQLYPIIASFFKLAGLPTGSIHLKQYSGMLQGIFEPVAERKKGTLEKIMHDFPERKFLLVGDSGEADLEVYTEIAVANPGRIAAIFIRDVTTPEQRGYFESGFDGRTSSRPNRKITSALRLNQGSGSDNNDHSSRPLLPPRIATEPVQSEGIATRDLIDLSEEREEIHSSARKEPPPRPAKPKSLQSSSTVSSVSDKEQKKPPALPPPRRSTPSSSKLAAQAPPPPPPRRRTITNSRGATSLNSDFENLDLCSTSYVNNRPSPGRTTPNQGLVDKKVELWRIRLERANDTLEREGVQLYTWRRGDDVIQEAVGIVKEQMRHTK